MIAVLQRVAMARVEVAGRTVGEIGPGLLILVCAEAPDTPALADKMVAKLAQAPRLQRRGGQDEPQRARHPGGLLIVSQFTLAADTAGGNRPSFTGAAPVVAEQGRQLYEHVLTTARRLRGGGAGSSGRT